MTFPRATIEAWRDAFMPRNVAHAWKNTGDETGRVLFYTHQRPPAAISRLWPTVILAP